MYKEFTTIKPYVASRSGSEAVVNYSTACTVRALLFKSEVKPVLHKHTT